MTTRASPTPDEGPVVDDLGFWACILDVSEAQLEFAVRMVGPDAHAVARYMSMLKPQGADSH